LYSLFVLLCSFSSFIFTPNPLSALHTTQIKNLERNQFISISSLVVVIVRVLPTFCCSQIDRCGLVTTRTTTLQRLSFVGWCQNDSGVGLNAGGGLGRAVAFI
jgi:hypothetical protein